MRITTGLPAQRVRRIKTATPHAAGVALTLLAACCFGLIPLFAKMAYGGGFNPYSFSLFRSIFTAVILIFILKRRKTPVHVTAGQAATLFSAAFFGYCLMMLTLCLSYNYMATGLATTLHFIYPVATMAGTVVLYKEKINGVQVGALAASLLGVFFLSGMNDGSGGMSLTGFILALSSGFFYAWYVLTVSGKTVRTLDSYLIIFYIASFNTILLFLTCLFTGHLPREMTLTGLMGTLMVAVVSSVIGMVAFQAGLKRISPSSATIISSAEVMTSLVVGVALLNETFTLAQVAGSLLIIASVIAVALSKKR